MKSRNSAEISLSIMVLTEAERKAPPTIVAAMFSKWLFFGMLNEEG
jgi:hypothetical protein